MTFSTPTTPSSYLQHVLLLRQLSIEVKVMVCRSFTGPEREHRLLRLFLFVPLRLQKEMALKEGEQRVTICANMKTFMACKNRVAVNCGQGKTK